MRTSDARPTSLLGGVALRHHPRRVPGVPDHRRGRGVPDRQRVARLGDRCGLRRARRRFGRVREVLPTMTVAAETAGGTAPASPVATLFPGLLRPRHGHRHHRHRCAPAGHSLARRRAVRRRRDGLRRAGCPRDRQARPVPPASRRRPDQPRQGLCVPHHRRRHQRARQRLGTDPRLVGACARDVVGRHRAVGRPALHGPHRRRSSSATSPALGAGINGTWFLLTVSTESIAVLGALLLGREPERPPRLRLPRRVPARHRAVPHRDDDGVPPLDLPTARSRPRPIRRPGSPPVPSPSPCSPAPTCSPVARSRRESNDSPRSSRRS